MEDVTQEQAAMSFVFRPCTTSDVSLVRDFVAKTPPLDLHSAFTYWVLFRYETALCHLAIDEATAEMVGFVSGVIDAADPSRCYLWQVGVHPGYRGQSIASILVGRFVEQAHLVGVSKIQFSIDPTNVASNALSEAKVRELGFLVTTIGEVSFSDHIDAQTTNEVLFEAVRV